MEVSPRLEGSHATASRSGLYIACIVTGRLHIYAVQAPERYTQVLTKVPAKEITALRWNNDDGRIAVVSNRLIDVVDLVDSSRHVRLDNGSGGLGKFASVDFVGPEQLLVIWEFGKAKIWNLINGRAVDLPDVKTTCSGDRWRARPSDGGTSAVATLSRNGAEDLLCLYLPATQKNFTARKTPTIDAQSLTWSPDGRWLAVLDTPISNSSVQFYTPDGHHFRSYSNSHDHDSSGLGVRSIAWAGDSSVVGLTRHDGKIVLLNTRTFTTLAVIEHNVCIDQTSQPNEKQAPIWEEAVAASGERTYTAIPQPFAPPLSRTKSSAEPEENGVAEACFSSDGSYLATRDERMLNTVWIWSVSSLSAHAVLVQHSNVRKMHWHPTRPDELLLDCGESVAYRFKASIPQEPATPLRSPITGSSTLAWLHTSHSSPPVILCSTKASSVLLYPEGKPTQQDTGQTADESFVSEGAEDEIEDSLLDLLTGKTPLPPKTEPSYTERVDLEIESEEGGSTTRMDDTFRGKRVFRDDNVAVTRGTSEADHDPFDDSDIF